jgi:hypothetical protein
MFISLQSKTKTIIQMEQLIQELKKVKQVDMHGKVFFPYKDLTEKGFIHNDYLQEKLNFAKDLVSKGWSTKESVNYYF